MPACMLATVFLPITALGLTNSTRESFDALWKRASVEIMIPGAMAPPRYSPLEDKIQYIENLKISINYRLPDTNPSHVNSDYDLVIVAPSVFESNLEKLVTHKNSFGVNTLLKTTEDIYDEFSGVDKP